MTQSGFGDVRVSTGAVVVLAPARRRRAASDRRRGRLALSFAVVLCVASARAAGPAITVPEVQWGYDGTVMRDRFNLLTIVVDNPSPEPFDGEVRLNRADFSGSRTGGFLVQPIYLAPSARRVVQFYPLILSDVENWVVAWDGGQATLPQPGQGGRARVLLTEQGDLFDRGGGVKRFPTRYFPSYVTATDGLAELVLDRSPDWEPQQRQAFLDWLRSGGVAHLIRGPDGRPPQFSGELSLLNEPSESFRIGGGLVRRHDVDRPGLTGDFIRTQLDPPPPPPDEAPDQAGPAVDYGNYDLPLEESRTNATVFGQLKRMVKAEHNWGVIHLLSLSYIAVLFPGCFLIGREFRSVPATFGAIGGATLLFGAAFYLIGHRGYGESTSVHAVALAEHVDGDRFDVTQWSSVFVTAGGDYVFSQAGAQRIYSDATDNERVGGRETAGSEGTFEVDVPPFSTRVVASKTLARLPAASAPAVSLGGDLAPVFRLPAGFPSEVREAHAVIGDRVVAYRRVENELRPTGQSETAAEFLKPRSGDLLPDAVWGEEPAAETRIGQLVRPLMTYSLGLMKDDDLKAFRLPDGRTRLFVYAPLPDPLRVLATTEGSDEAAEPLTGQSGAVLYSFDLPL